MPFIPHTFVLPWDVVWYFGCVPLVEQAASRQMAAVSLTPFPFAVADVVDAVFLAVLPDDPDVRLTAWREAWQVQEIEVDIDDIPVRVYFCVAGWPGDLWRGLVAGACAVGDTACASRPAWSSAGA